MKWVPDRTGRFAKRPHYLPEELDEECERIITEFLRQKYGCAEFPVKTDDLTVLIEQKADLDSYADLSHEGDDVEGVTEFTPGQRPVVRIADRLSASHMENRLRTRAPAPSVPVGARTCRGPSPGIPFWLATSRKEARSCASKSNPSASALARKFVDPIQSQQPNSRAHLTAEIERPANGSSKPRS